MAFLDRFKSKRERDVEKGASQVSEGKVDVAAKTEKVAVKKSATTFQVPSALNHVLLGPLVTEKAAHLAQTGTYTFRIATPATRVQVRAAVKALYGITPSRVNIQRVRGKAVRFRGRPGARQSWKKAIVTLPKGKKIDVYEGV